MRERGDDALQLEQVRIVLGQARLQLLSPEVEDLGVGLGRHGQHGVVVADGELAAVEDQGELLAFQHVTVLIAQDGQEDLLVEPGLRRLPLDVEVGAVGRGRAVFQQVGPPRVPAARDPHVIGDHVGDLPHAPFAEGAAQRLVVGLGAEYRIEVAVVRDVVAVGIVGARLQEWREVAVTDTEVMKILNERGRLTEAEAPCELEAVGRQRDAARGTVEAWMSTDRS